jgi:cardiolipin synthase A/B
VIKVWPLFSLRFVALSAVVLLTGCHGPRMELRRPITATTAVGDAAFRDSLSSIVGTPFVGGNRITRLMNGDEIFPAMLQALAAATNTIMFENYMWISGRLSDQFIATIVERAHAGVDVRVIVDALGSSIQDADVQRLREAGVKFVFYNPPWPHFIHRLNYRDHRKLLIIDGAVGFSGGACLADEWAGNAESPEQWRDTHFRVEGPVVGQIQGVFAYNWLKTQGELLFGEKFFPALEARGDCLMQAFKSSPVGPQETTRLVYLSAIAGARKNIRIAQSYFVPDDLSIQALIDACARGVQVEIITPSHIDAGAVRRASRSLWPRLLRAGVIFYEYGPAMYHCKIMIVDDLFVTAGSVNFDERSFHINDESNINVLDTAVAAQLIADFERDKAQSKRMTERRMKRTAWYKRAYESLAGLLRSQL